MTSSLIDWSKSAIRSRCHVSLAVRALTLGLGVIQAIMETIYYKTGNEFWKRQRSSWMKTVWY
ncbi:MAG: cytochrome ubiquinol oxidase subunit I [Parabacteroides merdae]